jgi:hypothetical protein
MITVVKQNMGDDMNSSRCRSCICLEGLDYVDTEITTNFYRIEIQCFDPSPGGPGYEAALNFGDFFTLDGVVRTVVEAEALLLQPQLYYFPSNFDDVFQAAQQLATWMGFMIDTNLYSISVSLAGLVTILALQPGSQYNLDFDFSGMAAFFVSNEEFAEDIILRNRYKARVQISLDGSLLGSSFVSPTINLNQEGIDLLVSTTFTSVCFDMTKEIRGLFSSPFEGWINEDFGTRPIKVANYGGDISVLVTESYYDAMGVRQTTTHALEHVGYFVNSCCNKEFCVNGLDKYFDMGEILTFRDPVDTIYVCDGGIIPLFYHNNGTTISATWPDGTPETLFHSDPGIYFYPVIPDVTTDEIFSVTLDTHTFNFRKLKKCDCRSVLWFKNCLGTYEYLSVDCRRRTTFDTNEIDVEPCVDCDNTHKTIEILRKYKDEQAILPIRLKNTAGNRALLEELFKSGYIALFDDKGLNQISLEQDSFTLDLQSSIIRLDIPYTYDEYIVSLPST